MVWVRKTNAAGFAVKVRDKYPVKPVLTYPISWFQLFRAAFNAEGQWFSFGIVNGSNQSIVQLRKFRAFRKALELQPGEIEGLIGKLPTHTFHFRRVPTSWKEQFDIQVQFGPVIRTTADILQDIG